MDIEDAWKAHKQAGESILWEKLREELDIFEIQMHRVRDGD